jgi:hypothetical protein
LFSRVHCKLLLEFDINDTSGKAIAELGLSPIAFVSDNLKDLVKRRGETLWKCRRRRFVSYHIEKDRDFHHSDDDRYMINHKTYHELHKPDPSKPPFMDDLGDEVLKKDNPPASTFVYLAPLTIKGYKLKKKKWLELQIDGISEVVWNKEAF